jgi:hypothetical protein
LQVAHGIHLAKVDANRHKGLRDLRRETGDNYRRAKEPRRFHRLHQVVRDGNVHGGHTGNIDHDDFRAVRADTA